MENEQYLKYKNEETSQYIEKVKRLLDSKLYENLRLALQLIASGGVPSELLTYLYVISLCCEDLDIAKQAHELFRANAPQVLLDYTQNLWDYDDPLSLSEHEVSEFLEETKEIEDLDTALLANLMLKYGNIGGAYCLKNNTASPQHILQEVYNTEWLSLSAFELDKLPPEVGLFTETKHLVLSNNNFTDIPDELQKLVNLERVYFNDTPLSNEAILKMECFFPKAMGYHYSVLGRSAFQEENYESASHYMQKALALDNSKSDYWNVQGVALGRLQNREEAIRCFDKALALNPQDTLAFSNKAHVFHLMGKETESLAAANAGLAIYKQNPQIARSWEGSLYFRKGQALFYLKQYEESHQAYDQALSIEPLMGGAWFNKACTYAHQQNKTEMLKHLDQAIRCDAKFKWDAPKDTDFKAYWQDSDFRALVGHNSENT
ncbi:tetratricopeptide repeat protein [uncultured Microscilla sp.]|uniref:tetratricopeptide repeat protein n=1 Tax=uncultured Microscilla sp. TaxID=432653 RepID=UPI00263257D7|nr:tetratricopeptide repeat protein [uncultured Microscilla sp.]